MKDVVYHGVTTLSDGDGDSGNGRDDDNSVNDSNG